MSDDRLLQLAARKAQLVERVRQQRVDFAVAAVRWEPPSRIIDRGVMAVQYLKHRPLVAAGVLVAIVAVRPRSIVRIASHGWFAWRMWGSLKGLVGRFATPL